jgi:hypothetical protein
MAQSSGFRATEVCTVLYVNAYTEFYRWSFVAGTTIKFLDALIFVACTGSKSNVIKKRTGHRRPTVTLAFVKNLSAEVSSFHM